MARNEALHEKRSRQSIKIQVDLLVPEPGRFKSTCQHIEGPWKRLVHMRTVKLRVFKEIRM